MSGWRFYPLAGANDIGVLLSPDKEPSVARFIPIRELRKKRTAA